jgi:hypothetical protein
MLMVCMAMRGMMLMPTVVVLTAFHHPHQLGAAVLKNTNLLREDSYASGARL